MTAVIIKIIAGTVASLAFAILFKVKAKLLPYATFGGFLACVFYFLLTDLIGGVFIPNVVAVFIVALLSEIFARVLGSSTSYNRKTLSIVSINLLPGFKQTTIILILLIHFLLFAPRFCPA